MDSLFNVFIFNFRFQDTTGAKERPVVTILFNNQALSFQILGVFSEKKKYINNSKYSEFMYKMHDWQEANLKQASYINVSYPINLPFTSLMDKKPIGKLSKRDIKGLVDLYNKYWSKH